MRGYVRRLLSSKGYEVESVADGQAALEAVRKHQPDLVLSDVMMPHLDGFELLQALRDDPSTRTIPVILLSARAGEESRVEGLEHGADDYLIKPFSARELLARVHSQLELTCLRQTNEERVSGILNSLTEGFHLIDAAGCFAYFNTAARGMFAEQGIDPDALIGKHVFDAFPDARELPAACGLQRTLTECVPTVTEDFYMPWGRWFAARHYPTTDGGVSTFFQDITERKQAESLLLEQKHLMERIISGDPLDEILTELCLAVPKLNPRTRACVLLADGQHKRISGSITPDVVPEFGAALQNVPINDLCIGTCGEAMYSGKPIICADMTKDERWSKMWRDLCLSCGIFAGYSEPILGADGLPIALFVLCFAEPHQSDAWENEAPRSKLRGITALKHSELPEIVVRLPLPLHIPFDGLPVCPFPYRGHIIPVGPKLPAPQNPLHRRLSAKDLSRRDALDYLHNPARSHFRMRTAEQMDMILVRPNRVHFDRKPFRNLSSRLLDNRRHHLIEQRSSIFHGKDNVVMDLPRTVSALSNCFVPLVRHTPEGTRKDCPRSKLRGITS